MPDEFISKEIKLMPVIKNCINCDEEFTIPPSLANKRERCSRECRKVERFSVVCGFCKKTVNLRKKQLRKRNYCSAECRIDARRSAANTNCLTCEKPFKYTAGRRTAYYCSLKCSATRAWKNGKRNCNSCGIEKDASEFYSYNKFTHISICISCTRQKNREHNLKSNFNLTQKDYDSILAKQKGVCAICFLKPNGKKLAVDHCHDTGKIRGLLCSKCNIAIGLFKDNPSTIQNALNYLS